MEIGKLHVVRLHVLHFIPHQWQEAIDARCTASLQCFYVDYLYGMSKQKLNLDKCRSEEKPR